MRNANILKREADIINPPAWLRGVFSNLRLLIKRFPIRLKTKTIKIDAKAGRGGGNRKSFSVRNGVIKPEYLNKYVYLRTLQKPS